jgi:hypothetical protein
MNFASVLDLLGAIVTVALVSTILARGSQFAQIVNSLGSAFSGAIRAAKG